MNASQKFCSIVADDSTKIECIEIMDSILSEASSKENVAVAINKIKELTGKNEEKIVEAMMKSCPLCVDE